MTPEQFEWLDQLAKVETVQDIATQIAGVLQRDATCTAAALVWNLKDGSDPTSHPRPALHFDAIALVRRAAARETPAISADGRHLAIPMSAVAPGILLVTVATPALGRQFVERAGKFLQLARRHLEWVQASPGLSPASRKK